MARIGLYLDVRAKNKAGRCSLKIVIRNAGTTAYHATGIELPESCWKNGRVVVCRELDQPALVLNRRIKNLFDQFELAFHEVAGLKTNMPAGKILKQVVKIVRGDTNKSLNMRELLIKLSGNEEYSHSTRTLYITTLNAINKVSPRILSVSPGELDRDMVLSLYRMWQERGYKNNTIRVFMSKLAAAYNYALRKRMFQPEDESPFAKGKWVENYVPTKRNIPIQEFRSLWNKTIDQKDCKTMKGYISRCNALRVFKLMFCLCGINVADLYRLTDKDIINGRIETLRQKTGTRISVKLEPEALQLIKELRSGSRLIGKAIANSSWPSYRTELIERLNDIYQGLTSYYARHTWATLAFDLDIPDSVIAMGLAHTNRSNAMNAVYINNDYRKLDKANRRILDYVEGKIEIE